MENQKNQDLMYLEIWESEESRNEKAQTLCFEKSQQDKEVLKNQYDEDLEEQGTEETEDILINPNHKRLYVKCMCDNRNRK